MTTVIQIVKAAIVAAGADGLPKLLGDGGACFWCGKKLLGQCKSHYDSLTCVQRPLDEGDGPAPREAAEASKAGRDAT